MPNQSIIGQYGHVALYIIYHRPIIWILCFSFIHQSVVRRTFIFTTTESLRWPSSFFNKFVLSWAHDLGVVDGDELGDLPGKRVVLVLQYGNEYGNVLVSKPAATLIRISRTSTIASNGNLPLNKWWRVTGSTLKKIVPRKTGDKSLLIRSSIKFVYMEFSFKDTFEIYLALSIYFKWDKETNCQAPADSS